MAIGSMNSDGNAPAQKGRSEHAFHVDRDADLDRWDVVDHEGRVLGHRQERGAAIDLAICMAQNIHGGGDDTVVCVEQEDGHYALAWSSR